MLQGTNGRCFAIWVITTYLILSPSNGDDHHHLVHDPVALDSYLHNHTLSSLPKGKTNVLRKVPLPANFSGMEVSIIRLKSIAFWAEGARFEPLFNIPPSILPMPFVARLEIMYQNLGNWSSYYYNLPGYSLVSPVIGLTLYDAGSSANNSHQELNLTVLDKPITINFTTILAPKFKMTHETKCVGFHHNGLVELSDMVSPNVCSSRLQGHFTVASPSPPPPPVSSRPPHRWRKVELWHWWVIGFGAGILGIVLLALVAMVACRSWMLKRIKWMEKMSEESVVLDTRWIKDSKIPSASMIRTQPALQNEYTT